MNRLRHNLAGRRFKRLVVHEAVYAGTQRRWLCRCDCGGEKLCKTNALLTGRAASCGCAAKAGCFTPEQRSRLSHGRSDEPIYTTWLSMRGRCSNPTDKGYPHYGGRGIKVCAQWESSFEGFLSDMGERPSGMSLDRIDVNGDYTPENCRWATVDQQARNKRNTVRLTWRGETRSMSDWADITGLPYALLCGRHQIGWPDDAILTTPKMMPGAHAFARGSLNREGSIRAKCTKRPPVSMAPLDVAGRLAPSHVDVVVCLFGKSPHGVAPVAFGGHSGSHHAMSAIVLCAPKHGLIERSRRGVGWAAGCVMAGRGGYVYRLTAAGEAVAAALKQINGGAHG